MKTLISLFISVILISCEITESQPFLQVGLENQSNHAGIVVELTDPLSYKSAVTNHIGQFSFNGLRDGEGIIICSFPFFKPDTQTIVIDNGEIISWNSTILKQLLAIEISYDSSNTLKLDEITESYLAVDVKYTNLTDTVYSTGSPYSPGICEFIYCFKNNIDPSNDFTLGWFGNGPFTASSRWAIPPGVTISRESFFIGYDDIVSGEYLLYLAPCNEGNDRFFTQLNEFVFNKTQLIRPLTLIIE